MNYTLRFQKVILYGVQRDLLLICYKYYILIKGYFQRFSNHAFHLLTYSVRSDSPQLFFPGSRELEVISPMLCRSHSSPAILCRLIWYCINSRHRSSSIMCINMFNMLCVFRRIYEYGLYIMHDLSLTWDLWECTTTDVICWLNALALL